MTMFKMFRLRRYRVFLICAVIITVILVRMSRSRQWEHDSPHFDGLPSSWKGHTKESYDKSQYPSSSEGEPKSPTVDVEHLGHSSAPESNTHMQENATRPSKTNSSGEALMISTSELSVETEIPDRKLPAPDQEKTEEDTEIHQDPPSRVEPVTFEPTPSEIHWQKQSEHFPVPTESLIRLPTGKPVSIPRIQHVFSDESNLAKDKREQRLAKVKEEFTRAWNGYKEHAWMHDEIKPVSGLYRDPFCGWAATLVDSLDTLWIMGLEEDFEDAVRAVGTIDFTTSPRSDIPVFETTIRYLGGLLAAYDVSGGNHRVLLDKAVELAEVLMGAFDTPNRMPQLFYRWRPDYSSQAHRASTRANLAELGSLAMEFTRLAQLTKEAKYYDAVARITNALEMWQNRGTNLPGVFPDSVDASGCNRSASFVDNAKPSATASSPAPTEEVKGYEPPMPKNVAEPKPQRGKLPKETDDLEFSITPGQPSKGHLKVVEEGMEPTITPGEPGKARLKVVEERMVSSEGKSLKFSKRAGEVEVYSNTTTINEADSPAKKDNEASVSKPSTTNPDWDCVPQGLTSVGFDQDAFSMGAGQDSTYEYFSKQYLLLGGLEPKYRDMYLKTMDAVRTHMLYRPMVPDDRDILFSGKVHTKGNTIDWVEYEATHLTCFLGGMVGMGSKVFDLNDLEIAKKLANGCVWAYESMAAGIMPESMHVVPCEKASDCHWNETVWTHALDPLAGERDQMIKDYETKKAKHEAEMEAAKLASDARLAAEQKDKDAAAEAELLKQTATDFDTSKNEHGNDVDVDSKPPVSTRYEEDPTSNMTVSSKAGIESSIRKRADSETGSATTSSDEINISQERLDKKIKDTETELKSAAPGREVDTPSSYVPDIPTPGEMTPDPMRPSTHKEYVASKIESEGLPRSVVKFHDMYILRPEAIESVWYMYRITGDSTWQDKGWTMFEHIINATRTNHGHSAITGLSRGEPVQKDEMESFWLAETLKYFYLLYSTPDKISLDEWVFNTEAHPFKRPKSS